MAEPSAAYFRPRPLARLYGYLLLLGGYWLYSGLTTPHLLNWLAESSLFISAIVLLVVFYRYFRFSMAAYTCCALYLALHVHGMHQSYPEAPAGAFLQELLHLDRNPYDRLVHFAFGLLLVKPLQELATGPLRLRARLRWWWPLELVLAASALYEMVEWLVAAVLFPDLGTSYLGFQGDLWDAQKDVAAAFAGAGLSTCLLYLRHRFRSKP